MCIPARSALLSHGKFIGIFHENKVHKRISSPFSLHSHGELVDFPAPPHGSFAAFLCAACASLHGVLCCLMGNSSEFSMRQQSTRNGFTPFPDASKTAAALSSQRHIIVDDACSLFFLVLGLLILLHFRSSVTGGSDLRRKLCTVLCNDIKT